MTHIQIMTSSISHPKHVPILTYQNIVIRLLNHTNTTRHIQINKYEISNNEVFPHSLSHFQYVSITLQELLAAASRIAVTCSSVRSETHIYRVSSLVTALASNSGFTLLTLGIYHRPNTFSVNVELSQI